MNKSRLLQLISYVASEQCVGFSMYTWSDCNIGQCHKIWPEAWEARTIEGRHNDTGEPMDIPNTPQLIGQPDGHPIHHAMIWFELTTSQAWELFFPGHIFGVNLLGDLHEWDDKKLQASTKDQHAARMRKFVEIVEGKAA